jgi:hypothetical protein
MGILPEDLPADMEDMPLIVDSVVPKKKIPNLRKVKEQYIDYYGPHWYPDWLRYLRENT